MIIKHERILTLLERLRLPERNWSIADHWQADLCAIGITSQLDPTRLVYISTFKRGPGVHYYECEVQQGSGWETIESAEQASYQELFEALQRHLSR